MNLFGLGKKKKEERTTFNSDDTNMSWITGQTNAGAPINEFTAMQISTVLACTRVLCDGIASLPLQVYKKTPKGKEIADNFYLYNLLRYQPNLEQTAFTWFERIMYDLPIWGNHYSWIERDQRSGKIKGLWSLRADYVQPWRTQTGQLYYQVSFDMNLEQQKSVILFPGEILHISGFGYNGLKGQSLINLARETFGLAKAAETFGAKFFGQGTHIGGILESPNRLSDDSYARLKRDINRDHEGLINSNKIKILEEGLTYKPLGVPPEDAQFLETRKFQRSEIAGIFRVPPNMIGDLENATFSNIEQQSIDFVVNTLRSWLVRIEQAIRKDLFTEAEQNLYFAEFSLDEILRGDLKSRMEAYSIGVQNGIFTRNEVRNWENLNTIEGGDDLLVQVNMTPASMLKDQVQANINSKQPINTNLTPK